MTRPRFSLPAIISQFEFFLHLCLHSLRKDHCASTATFLPTKEAKTTHSGELNAPELPLNSSVAHGSAVTFVLLTLGEVIAKLSLADIE